MKRYINYLLLAVVFASLQGCPAMIVGGVGAGALMASDRRTTGAYIEDEEIENKAIHQISEKYKNTVHVNVTSFNRKVLITGEVPNDDASTDIAKIVADVTNVKAVSNELAVSGISGLASRSSDGIVTGDVKLRFLNNSVFNPEHVKVITENGTVFLMGLVYRKEAELAAEIASTTKGVQRVVKVFEYLD